MCITEEEIRGMAKTCSNRDKLFGIKRCLECPLNEECTHVLDMDTSHVMVEIEGSDTERFFECAKCGVVLSSNDNFSQLDLIECTPEIPPLEEADIPSDYAWRGDLNFHPIGEQ